MSQTRPDTSAIQPVSDPTVSKEQKKKELTKKIADKLDQYVEETGDEELVSRLEKIVEKKKTLDAKKDKEKWDQLTAEVLKECKALIIKAKKRNDNGLSLEALTLLKKAAEILPIEHQKLKERINQLEAKIS